MLRQLLTLLALVSGLGLATTPAVAAQASVVSMAASGGDAEESRVAAPAARHLASGVVLGCAAEQSAAPAPPASRTPAVRLQADRARE
nr:hypothetical protein [Aurantiacibacter sp. 219JJ12-13]MDP5262200.1 hypothetical protein [Aurantiacibacter sp. 219JJ12-13]